MRLTAQQEEMFPQVDAMLLKMKHGETKSIKQNHPGYKNFMAICNFIRENDMDIRDGYYLIISPEEIRKENLDAHRYIKSLESALNNKTFLKK